MDEVAWTEASTERVAINVETIMVRISSTKTQGQWKDKARGDRLVTGKQGRWQGKCLALSRLGRLRFSTGRLEMSSTEYIWGSHVCRPTRPAKWGWPPPRKALVVHLKTPLLRLLMLNTREGGDDWHWLINSTSDLPHASPHWEILCELDTTFNFSTRSSVRL